VLSRFLVLIGRDLRLAVRQGMDSLLAVVFFVLAAILFPFGVGPDPMVLARIAGGVIWVAALLASLLSLEHLFQADYDDGSLDLLALCGLPLPLIVVAKVVSHWLTTAVPLIAATPVIALFLQFEPAALPVLIAALSLGTPTLSLIGAVGAAVILGARRGGVLLALLVLPLVVPVLIFGVAAVDAAQTQGAVGPPLMMLAALLLAALALAPWAAASALRLALE
jgi:heme exporter protein B